MPPAIAAIQRLHVFTTYTLENLGTPGLKFTHLLLLCHRTKNVLQLLEKNHLTVAALHSIVS